MTTTLGLVTYRVYPPLMGGQKGVAHFYDHLCKEQPVVLALSKNNALPAGTGMPSLPVLHQNKVVFFNLFRIGLLKKIVKEKCIRLIVAEHSYTGWIALLLKKQTGLPFIIHSHNLEALRFKHMRRWWWKLYWHYEKWIHQKADFNFFISDEDGTYALRHFYLDRAKCETITYGVESAPVKSGLEKKNFLSALRLNESYTVLFFNGTLDYAPNYEAVRILISEVAPRLKKRLQLFKILISGNRISQHLKQHIAQQPDFLYLDYVPDVNLLYQSAHLFLNPILNNTGVKTKLIEAIANHRTVVSTESGATGIREKACGSKLVTVADGDWNQFADAVVEQLQRLQSPTPDVFFEYYLWANIAKKAADAINKTVQQHAGY